MVLARASDLLGSEIVTTNGDTVGTVDEVLVDDTGAIQYVVFNAADFVEGAGTGTGAEPVGTTEPAGTAEPIGTLDNSTQVVGTLEVTPGAEGTAGAGTVAAPTSEGIATSTVGDATQIADEGTEGMGLADENTVLVFNGTADDIETQAVMLTDTMLDEEGVSFVTTGTDMPADMAQLEGLLRVSRLTDFEVMNAQDETLGQVEDWIVDLRQGMVQFGVVDFGGFLGIAENTVAVPWEQFTVSAEAGAAADANLMLDVNQDTLENAPQLNMSEWQSWPNPIPMDWETETRTFWETAS
jgi:sporulation protein YlmC with PRC-barrel domain